MSLPKASISLTNGALGGLLPSADRVPGILLGGGATEGSVTVNTPFAIYSLADLVALGVTSTTSTNTLLYRQVKEYYDELQARGKSYWMVVAATVTAATMADGSNTTTGVKVLLDYAQGEIRFVGICANQSTTITVTNGINANVYTAATNLQATLNTYASAQKPLRGVIVADSFSGTAASLTAMNTSTLNRVAILIGDTINSGLSGAIGLCLGRLSKVPVQRKISRVKDGALAISTAYIGTAAADTYSSTEAIHDKGFITIRTFIGRTGFFFTSDPTCVAATDDYCTLGRGRVIDKAHRLAYATYVNEVDDEVPVNTDGTIEPGYAKYMEQLITNQINLSMTANREISNFRASVPLDQNVVSTNEVKVVMYLQPVGYASTISISLGFAATLS